MGVVRSVGEGEGKAEHGRGCWGGQPHRWAGPGKGVARIWHLGRILTLSSPQATQICASNFSGAGPSSPKGVAGD